MATDASCLFCKIVAGEIPADLVLETGTTVAFRDLDPQAPSHVLVVPRSHHPDIASLASAEPETAVALLDSVGAVARQEGLDAGYRTVFNTGAQAQQSVFHVHAHVLGGRAMSWPPG